MFLLKKYQTNIFLYLHLKIYCDIKLFIKPIASKESSLHAIGKLYANVFTLVSTSAIVGTLALAVSFETICALCILDIKIARGHVNLVRVHFSYKSFTLLLFIKSFLIKYLRYAFVITK